MRFCANFRWAIALLGVGSLVGCGCSSEEKTADLLKPIVPVENVPPPVSGPSFSSPSSTGKPFETPKIAPLKEPPPGLTPLVPAHNTFTGDLTGEWLDDRGGPVTITADGEMTMQERLPNHKGVLHMTSKIKQKDGVVTVQWTSMQIETSDPQMRATAAKLEQRFMTNGPGAEPRQGSIAWKTPDQCIISLQTDLHGNRPPEVILNRIK